MSDEQSGLEEKLKDLIQSQLNNVTGVFVLDDQAKYVLINEKCGEITGYKSSDWIGKRAGTGVHEEDIKKMAEAMIEAFKGDEPKIQGRLIKSDNTLAYVDIKFHPFKLEGKKYILGAVSDIEKEMKAEQALRESEKKYKRLVETISDITYTINPSREITYISPQVKRLGYLPEELIGKNIYYLIHPDDIEKGKISPEFRIKTKDGDYRWVEDRSIRSFNKEGKWKRLIKITGTLRDITEKKIFDKEKDEFISIAVHDLITPVTAIKGYLTLLISHENPLPKDYVMTCLESCLRRTNSLENLIKDLLDSSRVVIKEFNYEEQDLVRIINNAAESLEELKLKGGHRLEREVPEKLLIQADGLWINQLMTNLLSNAYKYTPPGGIIKVGADENHEFVNLYVSDNGIGIPEAGMKKLFKRFSRLENAFSEGVTSTEGTGLGLYICEQIVKKHKGKIWAESEGEGKGSTFKVKLPIKQT